MNKIKFSISETEDSLVWHIEDWEDDTELVDSFDNGDYIKVIEHLKEQASDIYDGDVVLVNDDNIYYLPSDKYQVINIDGSCLYVIELSSMFVNRYVEPLDYSTEEFETDTNDIFLSKVVDKIEYRNKIKSFEWEYLIICN